MKVSKSRLFLGLVILTIGVVAVLSALDMADFSKILYNFWPVIFILFGLFGILAGNSLAWSGVVTLSGVWILLFTTQAIQKNDKLMFAGILIIAAFGFILSSFRRSAWNGIRGFDRSEMPDYFSLFGGVKAKNTSPNFTKASATAIFGGVELDLTEAVIAGNEAILDCFAAFGGIDIKVPTNWKVISNGIPLFGGFENKTVNFQNPPAEEKRLIIKGMAVFGGIDIKN